MPTGAGDGCGKELQIGDGHMNYEVLWREPHQRVPCTVVRIGSHVSRIRGSSGLFS